SYLAGLEDRAADGNPVDKVRSVASVFISRVDSAVDKQLDEHSSRDTAATLKGQIGVANTKMIYQHYLNLFKTDRFAKLAEKGAQVQRPLWASTGTKNPAYSDTLYVDNLIGEDTVNTMPTKTVQAFLDHGAVKNDTVLDKVDDARERLAKLEELGISLSEITASLLVDGLASFADSYNQLISTIQRSLEVVHEKS
ncbi:MAG: transaldolase family protein, partial [Candidatus Zixiibacteriota bacterium]